MSRMIFNTRERVVSTDHNRLQQFASAELSEIFRYWLLSSLSTASADGIAVVPNIIATPSTALVMNGMLVRPQIASTDTFVDPGVGFVVDTTGDTGDDAPAKLCIDPAGVTTPGALSLTPNASGSTRIDVVECQRAVTVLETASRDIYNPSTGNFSASTVDKVKANRVTYRIRTGTPGSGFPGTVSGWLPLAVATVPNGAANWDVCTVWDVRPLAADRVSHSHLHAQRQGWFNFGVGGGNTIKGRIETSFQNFAAGGIIPSGGFDLSTNDYGEPGWVAALTDKIWYLYACFPFSLPRWCKYTAAGSGSRVPNSFRGIPIGSGKRPDNLGVAGTALTLPTNTGLGGTSALAVALMAGAATGGGALYPAESDGGRTYVKRTNPSNYATTPIHTDSIAFAGSVLTLDDAASPGVVPQGAKSAIVEIEIALTGATGGGASDGSPTNIVMFCTVDGIDLPARNIPVYWPPNVNYTIYQEVEVPLRNEYPDLTTLAHALTVTFQGQLVGAGYPVGPTPTYGRVKGWRF